MNDYQQFIDSKTLIDSPTGFEPSSINPALFPWQAEIVRYACMRGRFGGYEDCGLGKSIQQLESARLIHEHTGRPVLILAPLAVAEQTKREAAKFDIQAEVRVCKDQSHVGNCINVANYERLHLFEPEKFGGVLLDEGSILKSIDGKTRGTLLNHWQCAPYRQSWSATPAPNDFMEIGNQAEFLGVMKRSEMLATFFVHDGGDTSKWRLKGHAREAFWRWMASWCVMVRRPSDLGHNDDGYDLPPIQYHEHYTDAKAQEGQLFAMNANTLHERRGARKASLQDRCEKAAELAEGDEPCVVWCNLNDEGELLESSIQGSLQVAGADSERFKELAVEWFMGQLCVCGTKGNTVRSKLNSIIKGEQCGSQNTQRQEERNTSTQKMSETEERNSLDPAKKTGSTCRRTTNATSCVTSSAKNRGQRGTVGDVSDTLPIPNTEPSARRPAAEKITPTLNGSKDHAMDTGYQSQITSECTHNSGATVPSANSHRSKAISEDTDYTSTTATKLASCEGSCVPAATLGSGNSKTQSSDCTQLQCTCGHKSQRRILISKPKIFGFGLNFQHCSKTVIFPTDSWEQWYQMVRRFWRFGQEKTVRVHVVASESEIAVIENLRRKEQDAGVMFDGIAAAMSELSREQIKQTQRQTTTYSPTQRMELPSWLTV